MKANIKKVINAISSIISENIVKDLKDSDILHFATIKCNSTSVDRCEKSNSLYISNNIMFTGWDVHVCKTMSVI